MDAMTTAAKHTSRNSAALPQEASMAFTLGSIVVNFGTTAMVVGFFRSADGTPSEHDGNPILREIGANGRPRGGKWVADPAKCEAAQ